MHQAYTWVKETDMVRVLNSREERTEYQAIYEKCAHSARSLQTP